MKIKQNVTEIEVYGWSKMVLVVSDWSRIDMCRGNHLTLIVILKKQQADQLL